MGRLCLVRHAQASFLSQNYDQLSSLGEAQARLLGEYWAQRKVVFGRVYSGPANRHRQTAKLVAQAYERIGRGFPKPEIIEELDEFQGESVLSQSLPQLLAGDENIRKLHGAMQSAREETEKRATFQRLFEAVVSLWVRGEVAPANVESWAQFSARVNHGFSSVLAASGKGQAAVIFTSGAPIGLAVERALHLSAQDTLRVAWMSRNCSFSEFLFSTLRFTLSTFNSFPHLDDDAMLTYR